MDTGRSTDGLEKIEHTPDGVRSASAPRSLAAGLAGGAVATLAMSALLLAAQKLGLLGELPPKKIARAARRSAGPLAAFLFTENATTVAAHFGFGMATGAVFGLAHRRRAGLARSAWVGAGYGALVWTGSYYGWVPALDIMPPPHRDRVFRPEAMFLAHLVFGGVLGVFVDRFVPARSTAIAAPELG